MKAIIQFLLFIAYTILIFFIKEYFLLGIVFIINIILMLLSKQRIVNVINAILKLMPFILFTTAINIAISGVNFGILIGIRLILVCNITYIFAKSFSIQKLQYTIEKLFKPLKIVNINSKEISVMVSIGVCFIPILQKEMQNIKYSLKAKGFDYRLKNILKKPNYILVPLTTSIIKRIGEIENSLLSKGYIL